MSNTTVKKQNKLLLAALVLILAAATVLVAITGSANRKKDENPPIENKTEMNDGEKSGEKTDGMGKTDSAKEGITVKENDKSGSKSDGKNDEKTASDKGSVPETKIGEKEVKDPKTDERDSEKTSADESEVTPTSAEPADDVLPVFITPVDGIVINGASLTVPVFSYTMNDYRTHGGLDFACSAGTPVCAAANGTVTEVTDDPMMGVCVSLSHSGGAVTKYKGLAEETIGMKSVGDSVKAGDVIGVSGDTALIECAEDDHVHFELSVNGETKDPAEYVSVVFLSDLTED